LNAVSEMGKQLDSFADFITFGMAPISIFLSNLNFAPPIIVIMLLFYPLAGGYRLARYNLQKSCKYFTGLPITAAGFIMVTVLLINDYLYNDYAMNFATLYIILALILSILMVSKFQVNRIL